jgi:putative glycerol-1-phosphate prenyltransferase
MIVGGGIRTLLQIQQIHAAGANIAVIGNKIEEDINFLLDIKSYIEKVNG